MRKVIASPFITLDGFIAGPQGELDWAAGGGEFDREMLPLLLKRVDTIVLGRVTYQELAAYWPFASTEDDSNAELMNTVSKLVFSRTLEQVEWGKWGSTQPALACVKRPIWRRYSSVQHCCHPPSKQRA